MTDESSRGQHLAAVSAKEATRADDAQPADQADAALNATSTLKGSAEAVFDNIFSVEDRKYEAAGLVSVPVGRNKEPLGKGWNIAQPSAQERESRRTKHAGANIGLKAGTTLGNGNLLAFVDIDDDRLVPFICEALGPFPSGKIGQKGLTGFAQAESGLKSSKIMSADKSKPVVEIMINSGMVVIPPSMHPAGMRYRWSGKPLLDVDLTSLPVLTKERLAIVRKILANPNAWAIIAGGATVKAHSFMLSLTSSGIAKMTDDLDWLERCLRGLFQPGYQGDTPDHVAGMLESAAEKGLGAAGSTPWADYEAGTEGPVPLGYTKEGFYALLDRVRQIIVLASSNQLLSAQWLLGLASYAFWIEQFPGQKGINSLRAGEALIAACRRAGPFNPTRVRGRGIWREGEQIIVNLGEPVESRRHLYLCFESIPLAANPTFDTQRRLALFRMFNWRSPQDAMFLLGWVAVAPICGVLDWRPHLFVYGPPRSGKTTIHALTRLLLDALVVAVDGQSSEAGIRQTLGPDSMPVIIDEFEADQSGATLRAVLRLARSASSADTPVLRGTPEGKAMTFSLRTAFFFAAVNPRGMSVADQSRIMMLELLMHDSDSAKAQIIAAEEAHIRSLGSAWCSYMVSLAGLIGPAIAVLEPFVASGDRRHRQNVSTLLGAAFVALHGRVPTEEEAQALADEFKPAVDRHAEEVERDDAAECLDYLFAHVVEGYPLSHWFSAEQERLTGKTHDFLEMCRKITAMHDVLVRVGGDQPGFFIRNGSPVIEKVFRDTQWAGGAWRRALGKLADSFAPPNPVQFPGAGKHRALGIPLAYLPGLIPDKENKF